MENNLTFDENSLINFILETTNSVNINRYKLQHYYVYVKTNKSILNNLDINNSDEVMNIELEHIKNFNNCFDECIRKEFLVQQEDTTDTTETLYTIPNPFRK